MANIHVLKPEISNKIAAGEVVERPSSVVKELVENSIDAGATKITVEIKNGGVSLISVTDNGCGMSPEDAQIAFLRHATSKIQTEKDLDAIYTLGFRGEALSSIGAVSESVIYSKRKEDRFGAVVSCEGGEIIASDEGGMSDGTKIVVRNLFYNTPARMKFLKKDTTEAGYVLELMNKFILAHPQIAFRFIKNGKDVLISQGDGILKNAIYTVYGRDYANNVIDVDYNMDGIRVVGAIGNSSLSRPNRSYQNFFINNRNIKSPLLVRAVEEAFKNQIMIGKFPVAIINVEINPSLIDINVHPTKLEVKFSEDKKIYDAVYYATKGALYKIHDSGKSSDLEFDPRVNPFLLKQNYNETDTGKHEIGETEKPSKKSDIKSKTPDITLADEATRSTDKVTNNSEPIFKAEIKNDPLELYRKKTTEESGSILKSMNWDLTIQQSDKVYNDIKQNLKSASKNHTYNISEQLEISNDNKYTEKHDTDDIPMFVIGQIFNTYIVAQRGNDMVLVDQHAAHERIKYEQLVRDLENKLCYPQMLIEPVVVKLSSDELAAFENEYETLNLLGFEAEMFGDSEIIVRAAPQEIEWNDIEGLVYELLSELDSSKKEIISSKLQRMIYTLACKAAVKANNKLTITEMESLIKSVFALDNINTCPHGRPITITITKKELEKMFKRIV